MLVIFGLASVLQAASYSAFGSELPGGRFNKWLSLSLSLSLRVVWPACLVRSTRRSIPQSMKLDSYRFTHWNAFRAFFRPGFLRSTTLASRVNKPAAFSAGL